MKMWQLQCVMKWLTAKLVLITKIFCPYVFMAKGLVLDAQGFPLSSNQAYKIGRANAKPNNNVTRAKAAEERI